MDNDGATNTTTAVETILNRPPIADFTESATTVYTGEFIDFNASTSYDPDGVIVNYFWNFGDGTNTTGVVANHAYSDDGVYTVTLTVTDDDGAVATLTESKTVLNRPPVAAFTESAETVYTSEGITFDASSSFDLDGVIVTYFWDFGDGINATGVVVNHAYTRNGTYTVTLTVTDDDGMSASTSAIKTVQNRPDVAVTHVTVSRTVIGRGYSMNVSVTVANQGEYTETFNVTLYANTTFVTSATITLLAGNSMTIIFTWNTAGFAYGKYKVSAVADTLPGEADVSDNTLADGLVAVTILGDVNGDLKVDGKDVAYAAKAYNTRPGQLNWNPNADVNCDGKVDGKDLTAIAKYFGTHYP